MLLGTSTDRPMFNRKKKNEEKNEENTIQNQCI